MKDVTTQLKPGEFNHELRKKVLIEINEDFSDAEWVNICLKSGMIEELVGCFTDDAVVSRELASWAIMQVALVEQGWQYIIDHKIVVEVAKLFEDEDTQIRANAYKTLINLADFMYGIDSVIDFDINIINILVDRLVLEVEEDIQILVQTLLKILLEGGRAQSIILTTMAHQWLNDHMTSSNAKIRELSALILGSISYNEWGKEVTIQADSIPIICGMLNDATSACRVAATWALTSLSQLKSGKVQIFELEKCDRIIQLLEDDEEQTRLNVVQMIANVAEYPPAREKFQECLPKLRELAELKEYPLVARFAQTAVSVIVWTP